MAYILEVPVLIGLILLHTRGADALLCAGAWAGVTLICAILFSGSLSIWLLLWTGGAFLLALGYFALLVHLERKGWWWVVMPFGGLVLLAFG
jgi:hypothetical protein